VREAVGKQFCMLSDDIRSLNTSSEPDVDHSSIPMTLQSQFAGIPADSQVPRSSRPT